MLTFQNIIKAISPNPSIYCSLCENCNLIQYLVGQKELSEYISHKTAIGEQFKSFYLVHNRSVTQNQEIIQYLRLRNYNHFKAPYSV